eukprot:305301_1
MLSLSILLSLSLSNAGRQTAVLDSCNYIQERNPDDGTYIGWYAIKDATPSDYCNYYNAYDSTGAVLGTFSWYYECDYTNNQVKKYFCGTDTTCGATTPCPTGTNNPKIYIDTDPESDFQCKSVNTAGQCLFKWKSFVNTGDNTNCTADDTKTVRQIYGVNGACSDTSGPGQEPDYRLTTCTEQTYNNVVNGYVLEDHHIDSACYSDTCSTWVTIHNGVCGEQYGGVFQAEECTGAVTPVYVTDGIINYLGTCEDNEGNKLCESEISTCANNPQCETLADYLLCNFPDCSYTFEGMEDPPHGFIYPRWCPDPTTTQCQNFLSFYGCIKEKECYTQYASNGGGDMGCDCSTEQTACFEGDITCQEAFGVIDFDNSNDIFGDINSFCNGKLSDGTTDADCTAFKAFVTCMNGCESGNEEGDCFDTNTQLKTDMFDCVFDTNCYIAFNALLGDIMNDEGQCDGMLCSPTQLSETKTTYCDDVSTSAYCTDTFNSLWSEFIGCFNKECIYEYCTDKVDICLDDIKCNEEINYVVDIENKYQVTDDDFLVLVKNHYCALRDGGVCTNKFGQAFTCAELNNCLQTEATECWETECKIEIDECAANGVCLDTLLQIMESQTTCEKGISQMIGYEFCPQKCDELGSINDYNSCGIGIWDDESKQMYAMPGSTIDEYNMCRAQCEECDKWLDIGRGGCGDVSRPCKNTFENLMVCVMKNCPDDDGDNDPNSDDKGCFEQKCDENGENCVGPMCIDTFAPCLFRDECYVDWQWVDNYFQSLESRVDAVKDTTTGVLTDDPYIFSDEVIAMSDGDCDIVTIQTGVCKDVKFEEDIACSTQVFQCYYYDIKAYCENAGDGTGTENENDDGCSAEFWNMLNCFFDCQIGDIVTSGPTKQPTMSPVECDIESMNDINSEHYQGWFVPVVNEICEYCICGDDDDNSQNNAPLNGLKKLICDKIGDQIENIPQVIKKGIVQKCGYQCEFECLDQISSNPTCNCDGWKCGICTTGGPQNPSNGNMFKIIGSVVLMLCIAVIY